MSAAHCYAFSSRNKKSREIQEYIKHSECIIQLIKSHRDNDET